MREIALHREALTDYVRGNHPEVLDHGRLKITELMFNPQGDNDLEWSLVVLGEERAYTDLDVRRLIARGYDH